MHDWHIWVHMGASLFSLGVSISALVYAIRTHRRVKATSAEVETTLSQARTRLEGERNGQA